MRRLATLVLGLTLGAGAAWAQDAPPPEKPDAAEKPAAEEALEFLADADEGRRRAKEQRKPLLIVVAPGWYDDSSVTQLDEDVLGSAPCREKLAGFVRVRLEESEDREVHVRHKLRARGYPLVVVLDADGGFLGSVSGLPADDPATSWPAKVAAVPGRHARMTELRKTLETQPEEPSVLFELGVLHVEAEEPSRADAVLARMEAADPDDRTGKLGEARYLRLRIAAVRSMAAGKFTEVEPGCLKWLRRFHGHARAPDVLLLMANALFLSGEAEKAKEIWKELQADHADTDAAAKAKKALDDL